MNVKNDTTEIQCVTGTSSLGTEIDLAELAKDIDIEHQVGGRFNGGVYKPECCDASILLFRSGTITVTGAKSKAKARESIKQFFQTLESEGVNISRQSIDFRNVVCTADVKTDLDLYRVAIELGLETAEYNPEQFTGLIYRPQDGDVDVTFLLFNNGSVVITGTKHKSDAVEALSELKIKLNNADLL